MDSRYSTIDRYTFRHLFSHFIAEGLESELREMLVEYDWLQSKLNATDIDALLSDYDLLQENAAVRLVQGALLLSKNPLRDDKNQLASQLTGRLGWFFSQPDIKTLLEQVETWSVAPWCRPGTPSLQAPGGTLVRTMQGHREGVGGLVITPDGRYIVSGSDGCIKVWEIASGEEICTLQNGTRVDSLFHQIILSDNYLVSHSLDAKGIKVWELGSWSEVCELREEYGVHNFIDLAITNQGIILSACNNQVMVWDINSRDIIHTLVADNENICALATTPDGDSAISGSADGTLRVWKIATGKELLIFNKHRGKVQSIVVTPDGKYAISTDVYYADRYTLGALTTIVWEIATGTVVNTYPALSDPFLMPDGLHAVFACQDNTYRVLEIKVGTEFAIIPQTKKNSGTFPTKGYSSDALAVSPDGRYIICESNTYTYSLQIWDMARGSAVAMLFGHTYKVQKVIITQDGHFAISASGDGTIKKWDLRVALAEPAGITTPPHQPGRTKVLVTPDSRFAITVSENEFKIWDSYSVQEIRSISGHNIVLETIALSPDSRFIIAEDRFKLIKIWDINTGVEVRTIQGYEKGTSYALTTTLDGRFIVTGSDLELSLLRPKTRTKNITQVWDFSTGVLVQTFPIAATRIKLSPDGKHCCLGGTNQAGEGCIKIYDLATWQLVCSIDEPGLGPFAITPDGLFIIYAISNKFDSIFDIRKLELATKKEVIIFQGHRGIIYDIVITPDGRFANTVSTNTDQTLRIWEIATGIEKHIIPFKIETSLGAMGLKVTPDGLYVYSVSDDTLRIWEIASGTLQAAFSGNGRMDSADCPVDILIFIAGDSAGWVHFLARENFVTGPVIVTAWKYAGVVAIGCLYCRTWFEIPESYLDTEIPCPNCGGPLKLTSFIIEADWHPIAKAWNGK